MSASASARGMPAVSRPAWFAISATHLLVSWPLSAAKYAAVNSACHSDGSAAYGLRYAVLSSSHTTSSPDLTSLASGLRLPSNDESPGTVSTFVLSFSRESDASIAGKPAFSRWNRSAPVSSNFCSAVRSAGSVFIAAGREGRK